MLGTGTPTAEVGLFVLFVSAGEQQRRHGKSDRPRRHHSCSRQTSDFETVAQAGHKGRLERPCLCGFLDSEIWIHSHQLVAHTTSFAPRSGQCRRCYRNSLRPKGTRGSLHTALHPKHRPIIPARGKVSTPHSNKTEMLQWFERHQMKCDAEFPHCSIAIPEIGRHPPAANPRVCQPRIERQRLFEPTVGFVEAVSQHEGSAAQRQRQSIVWRQVISLMGESAGPLPIKIGRSAETVGRALAPAPGGDRLRQSIGGGQFLRAAQFVQSDATLFRRDRESKRQRAQRQSNGFIEVHIGCILQ